MLNKFIDLKKFNHHFDGFNFIFQLIYLMSDAMNNFVINITNKFGYWGILFLITVENIFPPIPSEVILTLGGFMTSQENCTLNLFGVVIYSTLGSMLGAIILYFLGYILNEETQKKIIKSKFGKILCLKEKDLENSDKWFSKNGNLTVLYCRFIPIVRSLISVPAGMNKMKISIFLIYTFIGSFIWNFVLVILGNLVGENYMVVANIFSKYSKIILILIIFLIIYKIIKKFKNKKNS